MVTTSDFQDEPTRPYGRIPESDWDEDSLTPTDPFSHMDSETMITSLKTKDELR